MNKILLLGATLIFSAATVNAGGVKFIKGKPSIFKGNASFLIEFDYSKSSFDGLDTEEAFIEYHKEKKKDKAEKWERDWTKDKANFCEYYQQNVSKMMKKTSLKFSTDDPDSEYKMVVRPMHIETGNPMKYSGVEMKIHVYKMDTEEEVAIIHVPKSKGTQQGPMTPTVGMRVNYALAGSASMFTKYIKKANK